MKNRLDKVFSGFVIVAFLLGLMPVQLSVNAATADLLISEYIEGSSFNKAIEIYNGTGDAVDLGAGVYTLELYSNGSTTVSQSMSLSGTIADGDVFVLAHASADAAILAVADVINNSVINFNGDDAVVLRKNGAVVDAFGQIGFDPGSEWTGGGQDDTLRRKENICAGDTNPDDGFDASGEWDTFAQNAFDSLGTHTANCGSVPPPEPEILLTEIVVTPTDGEFIEIYNPIGSIIDLSNYYVTDATFAGGNTYYYNIVTGSNAGGGSFGDFHARFPDGATIGAGEYQTIAMTGSATFLTEYGIPPDYELFDDGSPDGELLMREALPGAINGQGGLSNDGEVVILYAWDGVSDLVIDFDYVVWGDKAEAVDKTGVTIDGPDADTAFSPYFADTSIASQDVVADGAHAYGNSWQRDDLTEGTEAASGGNGVAGEDETSENLSETWCESTPTPGTATVCVPPWVINEIHADPDGSIAGDANGDGTRDSGEDEFIEIVNNTGTDADISGWTISDGYSVRHTFPTDTVVPDGCAILVFGGGSPTGKFGFSVVQTASTGTLGFNNDGDSITLFDGVGNAAAYNYGSEGEYNQSLTRDPDIIAPNPLVQHTTASGSAGALYSPGTLVDGSQFAGCPVERKIHEVQGSGAASPLAGNTVVIEAIVIGDFQDGASGVHGDLNGFYVQEEDVDTDADPLTSEGIFVYDGSSPATDVAVGDLVRVVGSVSEFNDLTEITSFSGVSVISSGNSLPTTESLSLPVTSLDAYEAYEGMLVTFPQALTISEYFNFDRFGEIVLTSKRHPTPSAEVEPGPDAIQAAQEFLLDKITLDDGRTNSNPDPARHPNGGVFDLSNLFRGGDTVQNVTGVVDYAFGIYRIQPTQGADYANVNPRTTQPDDVGGNLKVASFNVLNYFSTIDDGVNDICGPLGDQECRGADDANEFTRQRDKIITAIAAIDADVVGLIEIENHVDDAAVQDLVDGLNDVSGLGTYDYVHTGAIGSDAIKVALIYKTASVSLTGGYAILDSSVDPRFIDTKNRPVLAQTFMDNATGGVFTVAVNHLKSKGTDCNDVGDPDTGDGAGNCNLTRKAAAEALIDWLAGDPTGSGDADFLIIGDLNSYDKEDPIDVILAGGYTDMIDDFLGEAAYSYVFDAQIGYLDYTLASSGLVDEVTGVTVWHINADEPDLIDYDTSFKEPNQDAIYAPDVYRASDHDPVIVGLNVCDEIAPTFDGIWVTPDVLWPVNHRYVKVFTTVDVSDNFDSDPIVTLVSVTSNEPDNGKADGNTVNDIVIMNDLRFRLRAERSAFGTGRIYTITYQVTDACGNSTTQSVSVSVPLNSAN